MNLRQIPILPTIVVIAAIAVMIALGFWQLGRLDEKEAMIARYAANVRDTSVVAITRGGEDLVYRKVELACPDPSDWRGIAGRNSNGQSGYVHQYACVEGDAEGTATTFAIIGWSQSPREPEFSGGTITGTLVSAGDDFKVIAEPPLAGLQANAAPDPNDLPNNHLAYAGQWFFFAITALIIYVIALKRRAHE